MKENHVARAKLVLLHVLSWMENDTEMNKMISGKATNECLWPPHVQPK
jgi:hypothetical protein